MINCKGSRKRRKPGIDCKTSSSPRQSDLFEIEEKIKDEDSYNISGKDEGVPVQSASSIYNTSEFTKGEFVSSGRRTEKLNPEGKCYETSDRRDIDAFSEPVKLGDSPANLMNKFNSTKDATAVEVGPSDLSEHSYNISEKDEGVTVQSASSNAMYATRGSKEEGSDGFERQPDEKCCQASDSSDIMTHCTHSNKRKRKLKDVNPSGSEKQRFNWKHHTESFNKPDGLQYFFLLGFSRGGYVKYPQINTEGDVIMESQGCAQLQLNGSYSKPCSPNELLSNLGRAYLQHRSYTTEIEFYQKLQELAKTLCDDVNVGAMFGLSKSNALFNRIKEARRMANNEYFNKMVVGFDWFGDEFGNPFCAFSHTTFVDLVILCSEKNEKFGVRLHAGEGLIRPSSLDAFDSPAAIAFTLHLYVLMESVYKYFENYNKLKADKLKADNGPNVRIGHGVAFLYGLENTDASQLSRDVHHFRDFLKSKNVVCELNPTSNHMLLPDTFSSDHSGNRRTLRTFLNAKLPVILCTDDDGIWALNKCVEHRRHISVAHEYCSAVQNDGLRRGEIEKMLDLGHQQRFRVPFRGKKNYS